MTLKKHLNEVKKGIKGVVEEGKKRIYKTISFIEQKTESDKGLTGEIKDITEKITEKGKEMHGIIQKEGGYCAALKRAGNASIGSIKYLLDDIEKKYESFKNQFFTGNEFDYEKTKVVLADRQKAINRFGRKTVDKLSKLVLEKVETYKKDYRSFAPDKQEREIKYAGIGIQYQGILLREDFDRCLQFYKKARNNLPGRLKTRNRILEDIKIGAIGDKKDLIEFYKQRSNTDMTNIVKKYF